MGIGGEVGAGADVRGTSVYVCVCVCVFGEGGGVTLRNALQIMSQKLFRLIACLESSKAKGPKGTQRLPAVSCLSRFEVGKLKKI